MPDEPRSLRSGRYFTEAELAAAAEAYRKRKRLTQTALAGILKVKPHTVSAALNYGKAENRNRGHAIRRRILALDGVHLAGPYWLPLEAGETPPGFDPHGEMRPPSSRAASAD